MSKCISAEIEIGNCMGDNMKGSYEEMQLSEDHMSTPDDVNMGLSRRPIIKTSPQVNLGRRYLVSYDFDYKDALFKEMPVILPY